MKKSLNQASTVYLFINKKNSIIPIYFEIKDYKNTGTYILKASEETSQLLDDHIVMTQSMSFSPYKKPFEDRISNWENKLKTTQVCFIFYSLKTQNKLMG
jgi:hypothetical protein